MIWIVACGAAAASGLLIYNFLEGESLLRDLRDEFVLSRTTLEDCDREWADNADRSDAVVTLTTIPSRLPLIDTTLKSLMRQTRAPKAIRLHVPDYSTREQVGYQVPQRIRNLRAVEIVGCRDWGPATKLIPAVLDSEPGQGIIVVDDDRIYPPTLVRDLEDAARHAPDNAFALSGWIVPADLVDRPTTLATNVLQRPPAPVKSTRITGYYPVDILQGQSGYLVRPEFFDNAELVDYSAAPEAAFFVDDVWFSAHCRAPILLVPTARTSFPPKLRQPHFRRTSLGLINRGDGRPENRNNTIMLRHFASRWRVGGLSSGR